MAKTVFAKKTVRFVLENTFSENETVKVLDAGCGTGSLVLYLPEVWNVYCLDASAKMLERARKKLRRNNIHFIHKDILDPSLLTEEFDLCIASFFLHEFPPQKAFRIFNTLVALVKPGGYLAVIDLFGE